MLIDWFTVIAQILNFLVLVWLLKRFLYQPVLQAIERRENKIKGQLQEAEDKIAQAEEERQAFRQKKEEFEDTRAERFREMKEEVRRSRKTLLAEARDEAAALRAQLLASVKEEKESLNREISRRMQEEVFAISRKVLRDLATAELEEQVVHTFVKKIQQLGESAREPLIEALRRAPEAVVVRSAFALPEAQQQEIEVALSRLAREEVPCRFEVAPDKILGIEVRAGGSKMGWSVAEYLYSLEQVLSDILHEEVHPSPETIQKTTVDESAEG